MVAPRFLSTAALAAFLAAGTAAAGAQGLTCPENQDVMPKAFLGAATADLPNGLTPAQTTQAFAEDGITLTSDPADSVRIVSSHQVYGGVAATTGPLASTGLYNLLVQSGGDPVSYTMTFAQPISGFSVRRALLVAGPSGVSHPTWSATAYAADGSVVATVGENEIRSSSDVPAALFTLAGTSKIKSITLTGDDHHFDGFANVVISDYGWCP